MTNIRILLILALVILISSQTSSSNQPGTDFISHKVGQTFKVKAQNGKVFSAIDIKQLKSKYFFIHVQMDWDSKNIPVKTYIYKQGQGNPIKICQYIQIDSCYLTKQQLSPNINIIILTDSTQPYYSYTLQTYWSDIQHLQINTETKFFFGQKDQTQFYHLELNSTEFHELRIILKPQTVRSLFDKVKIYGSFGGNSIPTIQKYDFTSMHLWEDAEGIFLYGKQIKDKNINLFIIGEIQTIYTLSCQIINNTHHDIQVGETVHEYLQPKEDFLYHAKFGQTLEFDEYFFTFSGFSGSLILGFYKDSQKKQRFDVQPFEYLNDAQYVFKKSHIQQNLKKGLYIYVSALDKKSVYSISFKGRNSSAAILLKQSIYEFIQIQHEKTQQLAYFQVLEWKNTSRVQDLLYSVSLTNVMGINSLQFRICITSLQQCTNNQTFKTSTTLLDAKMTTIGTKQSYSLSLKKYYFTQLSIAESIATIIIVIRNTNKNLQTGSFVALEYRSQNKIQYLRQNKPLQSRIKKDQLKVFKYQNQDPNLSQVKIYINEISGKIDIFSMRQQPQKDEKFGNQETDSIISFTKQLSTKPIFLIVRGSQQAIFSIQAVSYHNSDKAVSAFTLTEDLSFSVKIKPRGFQVVEVVPIYDAIYLEYEASGSILICPIDKTTNGCQADYQPKITKKGEINKPKFTQGSKMFKIMNPFQNQIVKVTLIYHSKDYAHCEQRQLSNLYYEAIYRDQIAENGNQNNCYHFPVLQDKDIVASLSRVDLGQIHYGISICNTIFTTNSDISSEKFKISAQKVVQSCVNSKEKYITLMVSPHKTKQQINKVIVPYKLKYLFEYSDEKVITIPDGVSYEFQGKTSQGPIKTFYYDLVNKKNTTIKLFEKPGLGSFTVRIVQTANKERSINQSRFDYSFSKTDGYFSNPTLTISKEQFEKKQCKQCSLIIKVYSIEQIGKIVKFGLQVSQNHVHLEDNKPKQSFLIKGSYDFYTYTALSTKNQGSLIVEVNDNNRKCATIFFSDFDYPDDKNNLESEQGSRFIYKDVQPQKDYYISIQAKQDCPYSILVTSAKVPITKLKRGINSHLSLKAGQVKYYMLQHLQKRQFKILSILKHGQTKFYMKKTSLADIENLMSGDSQNLQYQSFEIQSQFSNRIVLHKDNKYLAPNSYYLIAVSSQSDSEGYVFYGDSETQIKIIGEATINDQLTLVNELFRGQYYGEGEITLDVTVLSGQLAINMKNSQRKQLIAKNFKQNKKTYVQKFTIQSDGKSIFLKQPSRIEFKALKQNTVYSFKFKNNLSQKAIESKKKYEVKPGQPNFIYLQKQLQNYTLTGTFTHQEQLFFSVPMKSKTQLSLIKLKGYLENKQTEIQTSIVRNIMKIKFKDLKPGAQQYKLQVKTTIDMSTTLYQNYGLSLLAEDTQVLVQKSADYVLHPEGSVLLDVFECQGNANVLFSKSQPQGQKSDTKSLQMDQMPNQPHAIKILNPGTTFLRIEASKAFARWLPMNSQKQQGMGYLNYDVGQIKYQGSLLKLSVQWIPVHSKRQTKTKISKSQYVLIIAQKTQSIQAAINCQNYNDQGLLYYRYDIQTQNTQQMLSFDLDKMQIVKKYSQDKNLFIGIVADVQIMIPNQSQENLEHYRFVYTTQQIPLQVFKQYEVSKKDVWLVVLVVSGAVFLLVSACYICCKKILPLLSKLSKGNYLVEENTKEQKQFDALPPSSDRNQRDVETQEQMKS